jgi:hypothetical protein
MCIRFMIPNTVPYSECYSSSHQLQVLGPSSVSNVRKPGSCDFVFMACTLAQDVPELNFSEAQL